MGDVVDLNRYRKQRDKEQREAQAAVNRLVHGRSRTQRRSEQDQAERAKRELDGKQRDDPA